MLYELLKTGTGSRGRAFSGTSSAGEAEAESLLCGLRLRGRRCRGRPRDRWGSRPDFPSPLEGGKAFPKLRRDRSKSTASGRVQVLIFVWPSCRVGRLNCKFRIPPTIRTNYYNSILMILMYGSEHIASVFARA